MSANLSLITLADLKLSPALLDELAASRIQTVGQLVVARNRGWFKQLPEDQRHEIDRRLVQFRTLMTLLRDEGPGISRERFLQCWPRFIARTRTEPTT